MGSINYVVFWQKQLGSERAGRQYLLLLLGMGFILCTPAAPWFRRHFGFFCVYFYFIVVLFMDDTDTVVRLQSKGKYGGKERKGVMGRKQAWSGAVCISV
ncbi:hypothetical protein B0T24DRAFT_261574 [Lasiosphaeria ovina]|uniref:Uncharacterized protein n=1 Tax=Lasiosphaeria ovina TaxID=92902 RepID=A0AAE0KC79_9PEZI|nr:hypothetical protein B0T24DRAFT_261574 [Lasiosphaeria ovina]